MFGFKRRRAARAAAEAKRLEDAKREALAQKHLQAQHGTSRVPFSKRADVQQIVRAEDAGKIPDPALDVSNPLGTLNPASPLYAGNASHAPARDHAPAQQPACDPAPAHHGSHDGGSSGSSYDSGS